MTTVRRTLLVLACLLCSGGSGAIGTAALLALSGSGDLVVSDDQRTVRIVSSTPGTVIRHISRPTGLGARHFLENGGTTSVTIAGESTPTGVITPSNSTYELAPGAAVAVWYDGRADMWRIVATQSSEQWTVYLQLFGPVCDGATDDSLQIQAAVDLAQDANGTLVWPPIACATATTITVGGFVDRDTYMSIRGATSQGSMLIWVGDDDGVALTLSRTSYFKIEGLSIVNESDTGTTEGILMTGPFTPSEGSMVLASRLEDVELGGFHIGIQAGDADHGETSEMVYNHVGFNYNDIGIRFDGFNTLDQKFHLLLCGHNGICLQNHSSGEIWIDGGAATSDTTDIDLNGSAFGVFVVRNFRTEGEDRFITGAIPNLTVESCTVTPSSNEDHVIVELTAPQSEYLTYMRSSELWGYVTLDPVDGPTGMLVMENNRVRSDSDIPVTFVATGSGSGNSSGNISGRFMNNINAIYGGESSSSPTIRSTAFNMLRRTRS